VHPVEAIKKLYDGGVSYRRLARLFDVEVNTVYAWVNGKRVPSRTSLFMLSARWGRVMEILKKEREEEKEKLREAKNKKRKQIERRKQRLLKYEIPSESYQKRYRQA